MDLAAEGVDAIQRRGVAAAKQQDQGRGLALRHLQRVAVLPAQGLEALCHLCHRRALEEQAVGKGEVECLLHPVHDLGCQQRVPPDQEEVIVDADAVQPQGLAPNPGQRFLIRIARRT